MFEEILVATDGSDPATAAVGRAAEIAARYDAVVHVLFVAEPPLFSVGGGTSNEVVAEGTAAVDAAAERVEDAGVDVVETAVRQGTPHEAIDDYADEFAVDLVVLGTSGRGRVRRRLLGSTTERVVRTVDAPVLVVPEDAGDVPAFERILHPTDGSEESDAAFPIALELATEYGAALHVLSVVDERGYGLGDSLAGVLPEMTEHHEDAVERIEAQASAHGVECVTDVVEDVPYDAIVDYAADEDCDLIVMGSHGATGVEHALVGSVAEKVLRRAGVPVLVVPSGPRA